MANPVGPGTATPSPTTDGIGWYEAQYATAEQPVLPAGAQHERSLRLVRTYYDVVGDIYGRGGAESFHFAAPLATESYSDAISRYQRMIAEHLRLPARSSILDVGCGIGGPARTIAGVTASRVTGLELNAGLVARARELTAAAGPESQCDFAQGDFMQMPYADRQFDGAYHINSISHAPQLAEVYDEVFRVLKPGSRFVSSDWCLLDAFRPDDHHHRAVMFEIEAGNALCGVRTVTQLEEALAAAGFELELSLDSGAVDDPRSPWYRDLRSSLTRSGRLPKDSPEINDMLARRTRSLVRGGELGIFTPLWFTVARRP